MGYYVDHGRRATLGPMLREGRRQSEGGRMKILRYMAVAAVMVGLVGLPQRPRQAGATGVGAWRAVCHAGKYSLVVPAGWGFMATDPNSGDNIDFFNHSAAPFDDSCSEVGLGYGIHLDSRNRSAWMEFMEPGIGEEPSAGLHNALV